MSVSTRFFLTNPLEILECPRKFIFYPLFSMRQALSLLAVGSFLIASTASAATGSVTATSTSLGEYQTVSCDSNPLFSQNSCNQCFQGGTVKTGERLTGIFDNWINETSGVVTAYEDEQTHPTMMSIGTSKWVATPADEANLWIHSSDVTWTPAGSRKSFLLTAGQKIRFWESDLGAGYTLESTSQKHGDVVGMIRFPIVYHAIDMTTANEGAATTHYECVTFTLDQPTVATPDTPTPTTTPPPEATKTETGPAETLLLIVAAFFIAFGLMFSLRKRA